MMIEQIASGLWQIPTTRRDNAFLAEDDDGYTLVDVGWGQAPDRIAAAMTELGRKPTDIRRIVITHAHPDHVKGAAGMRERSGAPVFIHAADAGWLRAGRVPGTGRQGRLGRLVDKLPLLHWTPVEPDAVLTDGETVPGGLRVIHTPGHTAGHIVLVHEPTQTLLAGDAVVNRSGRPRMGPAALAADTAARAESLHRLPADVAAVGFAHGAALTGDGVWAYTDWLTKLNGP
jgi:glyoxylase-like metal-dependent hydrolase (beta-lactamase superfamily II)